ncbi:hypothetical protein BBK36DRAFT_1172560 [Trichoderma citrinoviride]|uniref:D-serine dehydratase-like domain-containing protein n=1 Tax=Trichoderma citrinoviride TaxID=58853 RepID=A0A2T4AZ72_9HYPO|nr:hypothetical protein BBK36DRAFT_1172560 [Trichoderma citrinoviride]PTB62363.1 hypothetical protein BBK36DRAFT_1172560 [Trichoderma citrinoviride]
MSSLTFYPPSPKEALAEAFVGKSLREVPTPAAVLNVAAARRNCARMLEAVGRLGLGWRAHVKTHKVAAEPVELLGERREVLRAGEGRVQLELHAVAEVRAAEDVQAAPLVDAAQQLILTLRRERLPEPRVAAVRMLKAEVEAMLSGAERLVAEAKDKGVKLPTLVVSAGASPTALAVQNLVAGGGGGEAAAAEEEEEAGPPELQQAAKELAELFGAVKDKGHAVEIHAGVYPTLDLQQLAAHSAAASRLSWRDIALTVVAEVHGVYPGRGANGTDEALIGAGGLALGREFCKAYDGMAVATPWGRRGAGAKMPEGDVEDFEGWTVGRFAQEHGILTWAGGKRRTAALGLGPQGDRLEAGQRVRLWPNHACITSSHFGWYFVVDEDLEGREDEVVDVWVKARGW